MRININPMSVNNAWQGRRFKTKDYKQYQKDMMYLLPKMDFDFKEMIDLEIKFGFSSMLSDIDNPLKPLIDCLQKKYQFNDRNIYKLEVTKEIVKKGSEYVDVTFREFKKSNL